MAHIDDILNAHEGLDVPQTIPAAPTPTAEQLQPRTWENRGADHDFTPGAPALRLPPIASEHYRGLGKDVTAANNDPAAIAKLCDLDWKTVPMPLGAIGKTKIVPFRSSVGLYRSDKPGEEGELGTATKDYKPHHNHQLLGMMSSFANEAGLTIQRAGHYYHGDRVFAVASAVRDRQELVVGDIVGMHVIMASGHTPGQATTIRAFAHRMICGNGAVIQVAGGIARFLHSKDLTALRIDHARQFVLAAAEAYGLQVEGHRRLYHTPTTNTISALLLADLVDDDVTTEFVARINAMRPVMVPADSTPVDPAAERRVGARVIETLIQSLNSRQMLAGLIESRGNRTLKAILSTVDTQPGAVYSRGTLAHPVNAVTNYVSNIAGRSADTGLERSLFGLGSRLSRDAMVMGAQYADAIAQVGALRQGAPAR